MAEKESSSEKQSTMIPNDITPEIKGDADNTRFTTLRNLISKIPFAGKHPKLSVFILVFLLLVVVVAVSIYRYSLNPEDSFATNVLVSLGFLLFLVILIAILAVPNLVAIWLVWRTTPFSARNRQNILPLVIPKESIKKCLQSIFESEQFHSTLRTALPTGEDDKLYGFDYIPFLLHSIDERRKRFAKSSRGFLTAIVILGLVFSGVVMYFGYILVNEASAGTPRKIADIQGYEKVITTSLAGLATMPLVSNVDFQKNCIPKLDALKKTKPKDAKYNGEKDLIDYKIATVSTANEVIGLFNSITSFRLEIMNQPAEIEYFAALGKANDAIDEFLKKQEKFSKDVNESVAGVNSIIKDADKQYQDPQNHIPEIIKRLALGIVVATFFLAILRYLGGIYQNHYQEMLLAEHEDLAVRRFYVGFKSSAANDEQRKAVLSTFIAGLQMPVAKKDDEASGQSSKLESEILKELFSALSKKL